MRVPVRILFVAPVALLMAQDQTVPIENEYVRVVSVVGQPHKVSAAHQHDQNRVMIYFDSGDIVLRYADGKVENQHWKPGDIAWSPAGGTHTSENVSDRPLHIVEIELRKSGSGAEAPPDRTRAVIDNSQVRVYQGSNPPQGKNYVAVNMKTGAAAWNELPKGPGPFVIVELK